mmetsp:Transcript_26849/g.63729  ORF Transcript_26849/g.63729 Transcript_26849/m.63729 type:complete len:470 (+) Transcript_26849:3155-4564(+)
MEPDLKRRQLLAEEGARLELGVGVPVQEVGQLREAPFRRKVPRLPHRVLVRRRHLRVGDRVAVGGAHDPLRKEEVAEERRHEQVLSEELLEERPREHVPGDGVGNGGEDPVELPEECFPVCLLPGDAVDLVLREALVLQERPRAEPPERDLDGRREAGGEHVGRELGGLRQELRRGAGGEQDDLPAGGAVAVVAAVMGPPPDRPVGRAAPRPPAVPGGELLHHPLLEQHLERVHDEPRGRAVKDVDGRGADPRLQVVDAQRDVLGVVLVEDPDLAVDGRARDPVAVVVEQHPLALGVAPRRGAELLHVVRRGVEVRLVLCPRLPPLVLCLEVLADGVERLLAGHGQGVDPALEAGAGGDLDHIGRVHADVEANDEGDAAGLQALLLPPLGSNLAAGAGGGPTPVAGATEENVAVPWLEAVDGARRGHGGEHEHCGDPERVRCGQGTAGRRIACSNPVGSLGPQSRAEGG